jgi:hypothetical protein
LWKLVGKKGSMNVIGVPAEFLQKISDELGIHLQIHRIEDGDVKLRLWPVVGKTEWRAQTLAGRFKTGLCFHVQHSWMALIFHAYPDAIIQTYYTRWNLTLFEAGALPWTKNEIASRGMSQTCACTPEMEAMTLVTPSMLDKLGERKVNGI